jgi:beta-lactamase superfamily II metal-dependent hydrolase
MPALVHFIDVGQGNMALIQVDGYNVVVDCNIRDDNERRVLGEVGRLLPPQRRYIDAFINTHRDADHLSGVDRLNRAFPIRRVWDSGAAGGTTDSPEYRAYMQVRRDAPERGILPTGHTVSLGAATIRVLHGASDAQPDDCNRESVVFKLEHGGNSVLFAGDCDTITWKRIVTSNPDGLASSVLVAPHHGAIGCLEEDMNLSEILAGLMSVPSSLSPLQGLAGAPSYGVPVGAPVARRSPSSVDGLFAALATAAPAPRRAGREQYTGHLALIRPRLTIVSVGRDNSYGHPSAEALRIYERYTTGFDIVGRPLQSMKIARTDEIGSIWVNLPDQPSFNWWWYPS